MLFYSRRSPRPQAKERKRDSTPVAKSKDVAGLLEGLNRLGHTTATAAQVEEVTQELFPQGTGGIDQSEVLRAVFLELRRRYSAGNAGR